MNDLRRETVTLARGFVDPDSGRTFPTVTLRAPIIEDELRRDGMLAELADVEGWPIDQSEAARVMGLVFQCIETWEGIPQPRFVHVRSLSRSDANVLLETFHRLEVSQTLQPGEVEDPEAYEKAKAEGGVAELGDAA